MKTAKELWYEAMHNKRLYNREHPMKTWALCALSGIIGKKLVEVVSQEEGSPVTILCKKGGNYGYLPLGYLFYSGKHSFWNLKTAEEINIYLYDLKQRIWWFPDIDSCYKYFEQCINNRNASKMDPANARFQFKVLEYMLGTVMEKHV